MNLVFLFIIIISLILIINGFHFIETFTYDQTTIPQSQPDSLTWNFQSPKSGIKNFNETTTLHQGLNPLKGNLSNEIGLNQPSPDFIYPYTYMNRAFEHVFLWITNSMEKDHNNNRMLEESNNAEWTYPYPYQMTRWDLLDEQIKYVILDVMREINRRFNMDPPIVGFRRGLIHYYWVNHSELIVIIGVYKRYTACDIEYLEDLDPNINQNLKLNFEKNLLIYLDNIDDRGNYHLKYLRFPKVEYSEKNPLDNMRYVKEFDTLFYLARSKDPYYRMLRNTEARDLYLEKVKESREKPKYKCFNQKSFGQQKLQRVDDRTSCDLAEGIWEKKCEKDFDCPYFKANKNYPNTFGSCNLTTGYCEWPYGVNALTYRKPQNPQDALCYNCINGILGTNTIGHCCSDQKNKRLYVNLETPDYFFQNDTSTRYKYRSLFDKYNLNWAKYI